jgi:hypothetical protein
MVTTMMRRVMLLAASVLALAGCAVGMGGGAAPVGAHFIGTWAGQGTQINPAGEFTIEAVIVGGPVQQVGTISYPSLECGGVLVLRSGGANWLEVGEDITYGECEDDGIVTFTPTADGRLRYQWRKEGMNMAAEGMLTRVR